MAGVLVWEEWLQEEQGDDSKKRKQELSSFLSFQQESGRSTQAEQSVTLSQHETSNSFGPSNKLRKLQKIRQTNPTFSNLLNLYNHR